MLVYGKLSCVQFPEQFWQVVVDVVVVDVVAVVVDVVVIEVVDVVDVVVVDVVVVGQDAVKFSMR